MFVLLACAIVMNDIQVAIASGFHLFPFRTEKLSPSTPMVLPNGGRVGSRRPIRTAWKDEMIFSSGFRFVEPWVEEKALLSRLSRNSRNTRISR